MPNQVGTSQVIRFATFEADLQAQELRKGGLRLKLSGQPFQVLAILLEHPGLVVTREELQKRLWPDTFVDVDHNLNTAINKIREALGDSAENPRFVETLPRRGYRFIAFSSASLPTASGRQREMAEETPPQREQIGGNSRFLYSAAATILFGATAVFGYLRLHHLRTPQIISYAQVTRDSQAKTSSYVSELLSPMVSDGSQLYFMAGPLGNKRLMQVSTAGGETSSFGAPFGIRRIVAASANRHELMALSSEGDALASESPLIVLPLPAGAPRRVGDILAHDASWSADGTRIVYAKGHELYVAKSDGTESRRVAALPNSAWWPRWSPDGQVVRFTVLNEVGESRLWEVSSEGGRLHRLLAEEAELSVECCGNWTMDGSYFVFASARDSTSQLWVVREGGNLDNTRVPIRLSAGPMSLSAPLPASDGKRLFAIATQTRGQLVRYDARIGQFVAFLSGVPAADVDFSADGKWVTYVSVPDRILWRSRADGSERRQLTLPPMEVSLPRWSPDGNHIAFLGHAAVGKALQDLPDLARGGNPRAGDRR